MEWAAQDRLCFRAMRIDADQAPLLRNSSTGLGTRVPGDIGASLEGVVYVESGGVSVTFDDPQHLPPNLRPRQYAGGKCKEPLWVIEAGAISPHLRVRLDPADPTHGLVEPRRTMHFIEYTSTSSAPAVLGDVRERTVWGTRGGHGRWTNLTSKAICAD